MAPGRKPVIGSGLICMMSVSVKNEQLFTPLSHFSIFWPTYGRFTIYTVGAGKEGPIMENSELGNIKNLDMKGFKP